jgi:hypothetical protein
MVFFPGGKVRDVSESSLSVLAKLASLAAEPKNATRAWDQFVASLPALERAAIHVSEIGLGDAETCDNTATADTGDSMGGCPTIRKQTTPPAISRPKQRAFDCYSNYGYCTSVGSAITLAGHEVRHVS